MDPVPLGLIKGEPNIWVATAWMHIVSKTGHNLF